MVDYQLLANQLASKGIPAYCNSRGELMAYCQKPVVENGSNLATIYFSIPPEVKALGCPGLSMKQREIYGNLNIMRLDTNSGHIVDAVLSSFTENENHQVQDKNYYRHISSLVLKKD